MDRVAGGNGNGLEEFSATLEAEAADMADAAEAAVSDADITA
jgi:hypothetical protein